MHLQEIADGLSDLHEVNWNEEMEHPQIIIKGSMHQIEAGTAAGPGGERFGESPPEMVLFKEMRKQASGSMWP